MRSQFRLFSVAALVVLMLTGNVYSSGFSIFEQGARAMGMAGAFAARANDLSSIFHNPAGLTNLYGTHYEIGTSLINVAPKFTQAGTYLKADAVSQWFYPSTALVGTRLTDKIVVAFGFYTPFGLGMKWDDDWIGKAIIKEINLETFNLNPVVAYQVNEKISVAVGLQFMIGKADLSRFAAALVPNIEISGSAHGLGFNAGIQAKPNDQFSIGFVYRSEITLDVDGDAEFTYVNNDPFFPPAFPSGPASLSLTTPAMMFIGAAYHPTDKWAVEVNANWTGWSSYDELLIDFENNTPYLEDSHSPKLWEDVWSVRAGFEYFKDETWTFRCGTYFDKSPVDDEHLEPILPDSDRNGFNIGVGWQNEKMHVDFAFLRILAKNRTTTTSIPETNFNGSYENNANLFGLSFGYKIN